MLSSILWTGLAIGAIYALIAITYNVMFSASRVMSFTAGQVGMLGGLGNNRGAIVGGLLLGLFQQAANFLVGGVLVSVAVFAAFIIVLMAAPQGLFEAQPIRRV